MKKSYVKPQVYFEDFQLSASIAGNCGPDFKGNSRVLSKDINTCGYQTFDGILFLTSNSMCNNYPQNDEEAGVCYQNASEGNMIFAS